MEDFHANNKLETKEELLEKVEQEIEILESIFDGEGIVLAKPSIVEVSEAELSTNSSGKSNQEEE
jgi:hypothetical protein